MKIFLRRNPFCALKLRETSMQIKILVGQAGFVKKDIFSQLAFVYILSSQFKLRKWKEHTRSEL